MPTCSGVKSLDIPHHDAPIEAFRAYKPRGIERQCRECKYLYNKAYSKGELSPNTRTSSIVGKFITALEVSPLDALIVLKDHAEESASGCWIWTKSTASGGYGAFRVTRAVHFIELPKLQLVHRWAFWLSTGIIPSETIHHKCANRRCFNPEHLEQITLRDNIGEMFARRAYEEKIAKLESRVQELETQLAQQQEH